MMWHGQRVEIIDEGAITHARTTLGEQSCRRGQGIIRRQPIGDDGGHGGTQTVSCHPDLFFRVSDFRQNQMPDFKLGIEISS